MPREYLDFAGVRTIGYGHAIQPHDRFPPELTLEQGRALLRRDLLSAETVVNLRVKVPMTQHMFDALVSLVFNIGINRFREHVDPKKNCTVLSRLNAGDVVGAAEAFAMWNKATIHGLPLQVSATLTRRRRRERDVFLKPE